MDIWYSLMIWKTQQSIPFPTNVSHPRTTRRSVNNHGLQIPGQRPANNARYERPGSRHIGLSFTGPSCRHVVFTKQRVLKPWPDRTNNGLKVSDYTGAR